MILESSNQLDEVRSIVRSLELNLDTNYISQNKSSNRLNKVMKDCIIQASFLKCNEILFFFYKFYSWLY
jgi:hypothetical protein